MKALLRRLSALAAVGVLVGAGGVIARAEPAAADTDAFNGYVRGNISSRYNGRCLDAKWEEIGRNGTRIQLWDCYGVNQRNQQWRLVWNRTRAAYQIRSAVNGRCLDAKWEEIGRNGTQVQLWDCYGVRQINQYWRFVRVGQPGNYQIRSAYNQRCLDGELQSIARNGTKVQLWDCYGPRQRNQHWRLH